MQKREIFSFRKREDEKSEELESRDAESEGWWEELDINGEERKVLQRNEVEEKKKENKSHQTEGSVCFGCLYLWLYTWKTENDLEEEKVLRAEKFRELSK